MLRIGEHRLRCSGSTQHRTDPDAAGARHGLPGNIDDALSDRGFQIFGNVPGGTYMRHLYQKGKDAVAEARLPEQSTCDFRYQCVGRTDPDGFLENVEIVELQIEQHPTRVRSCTADDCLFERRHEVLPIVQTRQRIVFPQILELRTDLVAFRLVANDELPAELSLECRW